MDNENKDMEIYLSGGFSMSWTEDTTPQNIEPPLPVEHKSVEILEQELAEIKEHLQDVQNRRWQIAKDFEFLSNNFS